MRGLTKDVCALFAAALLLAGCARESVDRVEWTTMGTIAAVQTRGTTSSANRATLVASFRDTLRKSCALIERRLNAHDPKSELSQLAPLDEAAILARCEPAVSNCYASAFQLMRESEGAFNPRWRGTGTLDLGAIAKGFTLDVACEDAVAKGAGDIACEGAAGRGTGDVLFDLGGNLKVVRGVWKVGVAGSDKTLTLTNGMACATSAEYFRGKHIYDGRTGCAVTNGLKSVTVVHPTSAMLADGLSTTLFVLGRDAGEAFLVRYHPEARAIWVAR